MKAIYHAFLCRIGFHAWGEVGRYYSGDGPEVLIKTCCWCGMEE